MVGEKPPVGLVLYQGLQYKRVFKTIKTVGIAHHLITLPSLYQYDHLPV